MADDNQSSSHPQGDVNVAPRHSTTQTSRSRRSYSSYGNGESSSSSTTAGALHGSFSAGDSTGHSTYPENDPEADSFASRSRPTNTDNAEEAPGKRRSHRSRQSGGFLLSNSIFNDRTSRSIGPVRDDGRRRSKIPTNTRNGKGLVNTPTDPMNSTRDAARGVVGHSKEREEQLGERPYSKFGRVPSPQPNATLDVESTQIVSMALNLSESRRMAQRRNISSPVPPRLAQLPDTPAGGSLKQHLQQQRRTSRNISPKADRSSLAARNVSISHQRINSPLQASFDPESSYTYHFSSSTLNRAQKAKEHLELMAQYRRLLQLVPPLKYTVQTASRPSTSTPPASPTASSAPMNPLSIGQVSLGRPYNPLQYIRNRKVRARERKAIDGEAQGFTDVAKVTDWVDQAATLAATTPLRPDLPAIPHYPGAHSAIDQPDSPSNSAAPISNATKPKRPRIDWVFEPSDLLADLYWVEQDNNRSLIEDRHYARIFPKNTAVVSWPMPQQTEEIFSRPIVNPSSMKEGEDSEAFADLRPSDSNAISRADTEVSHTSARNRARQKLHELRGLHHRHNSSVHSHHDFLHLRKGSFSDTSDSDIEHKLRGRRGTVNTQGKAILEKQMNEMLAKEAQEVNMPSIDDDFDSGQYRSFRPTLMTPDKASEPPTRGPSRNGSRIEDGEFSERIPAARIRHGSPVRPGRASLEVPGWNARVSMDLDASLPPSPDLRASKGGSHYIPAIGMDLSPPGSRPVSPIRNPFSKVKSIFRDRSRERGGGQAVFDKEEKNDSSPEQLEKYALSPVVADVAGTPERRRSRSRNPFPRADTQKSHKSMGSVRLGREDQLGLRGMLKSGSRIDGFIRGGVSKMSDFLWRKDQDGDGISSGTSSDESELEPSRGRLRTSAPLSRAGSTGPRERHHAKHYLDIMPPFKSTSGVDKSTSPDSDGLFVPAGSRPPRSASRRSARFEKLKPPRIDVLNGSPGTSPIMPQKPKRFRDSEASDTESHPRDSSIPTSGPRRSSSQLNAILSLPPPPNRPHSNSLSKARHWSISDRSNSPQRATQLSKREVARLRALILSSGIKAMEIARRARDPHPLIAPDNTNLGLTWTDMSRFVPSEQASLPVPQIEVYSATADILATSIEAAEAELAESVQSFAHDDMRKLRGRAEALHTHVTTDLIDMTRRAADEADECSRDVVDSQRLKVKRVVDIIDKMMRRRRRRFRWVRRGGWLMVEWVLVGFMWYVWFLVMIARIFLGMGRGILGFVRWLFWL